MGRNGCVAMICVYFFGKKERERKKRGKEKKMRSERAKSGIKEAEAQKIRLR